MEGRHTAGPWAAERGDMGGPWQITAGPLTTLAAVNTHGDNPEADARLMSAAPDLLSFARLVIDRMPCRCDPRWVCTRCMAERVVALATRPVTPTNPVERRAER